MDVPITEPATPVLQSYNDLKLSKTAEDSGYHTSFTPDSIELTRLSNETPSLLSPKIVITGHIQVAKSSDFHRDRRLYSSLSSTINECVDELTPQRCGVKRPYENDLDADNTSHSSALATPTSVIAGKIQKLVFDDNKHQFSLYSSSVPLISEQFDSNEQIPILSYPTTPVKKVCKGGCKLSPFNRRKLARKVEFATHSLSCERKALQPARHRLEYMGEQSKGRYKPNQKFDIIKSLFDNGRIPVEIILKYLSNEDIFNFILVSDTWRHIWENCLGEKNKLKQEYVKYEKAVSSNVENWENGVVPKLPDNVHARTLREIHNEVQQPSYSPPGTPRTNRFKKFTRAASEDIRTQLSCVKCQYPAKVTKEKSGEVWAECTNVTCAFQFCKSCKGRRHPGTSCLQYDLDGPSPSKRKKNFYPISSKKSKKNLCRLLC